MQSHFLCDLCRTRDLEMSDELVGGSHDLTVAARDMAANVDPSTSSTVQPIGTVCKRENDLMCTFSGKLITFA